ncbi:hypothetical protein GDO81_022773 [Engystomops pustulosus]|uniref:Uncharacterized protein n=1 Tax=Engystomops pustulosus TaxID=76066 RepID=A0AAV6ZNJ7_ENGPU|nr:hypothetical protein GDO81_022773 [Engystomops pustulosus]
MVMAVPRTLWTRAMDTNNSDTEDPSASLLPTPPPDDDDDYTEDAFEILARVTPSPENVPWEQRTTKMKIVHWADRIFLTLLAIFLLILVGEVSYILYNIVPWAPMFRALKDRLLMQEEGEEDLEL